jgi:hypothetical protein
MAAHQPEHQPTDQDPDDGGTSWWGLTVVTLTFTAITIALAMPGVWEEYVVGSESRRYRGVLNLLESIGYEPIILTTAGIALVSGIAGAASFLKAHHSTPN